MEQNEINVKLRVEDQISISMGILDIIESIDLTGGTYLTLQKTSKLAEILRKLNIIPLTK
jgi:hypothetical protein